MFRTNDHSGRDRGFSLTELIIAMSIAAVIGVAVISAYLFLGRNLTRSLNTQRQEVEGRRAVQHFTRDFSAAATITSPSITSIQLTKKIGDTQTETLSYRLHEGALERYVGTLLNPPAADRPKLATGLVALEFFYFNEGGTRVSPTAHQSIKAIELSFTSALGSSAAGTLTRSTTVSPRVVLRNKQLLQ